MIGALLRAPWEEARRRMLAHLHEQGFTDLDMPHLTVLLYPGPQGTRPTELAARLGVTKQALNYLLKELERLGYIARLPDADDRRARRIALTSRGRALGTAIREAVAEVERDWEAELGAARFARLRDLLVELNRVVRPDAVASP
jgi:DNA-binding MarR family transcriptional regulator